MAKNRKFPSFFIEFAGAEAQIGFFASPGQIEVLFDGYVIYELDGIGEIYSYMARLDGQVFQVNTVHNLKRTEPDKKVDWYVLCHDPSTAQAVLATLGIPKTDIQTES